MAISSYEVLLANNVGDLNAQIAKAIAANKHPIGWPMRLGYRYAIAVAAGAPTTFVTYTVTVANDAAMLNKDAALYVGAGGQPYGPPIEVSNSQIMQVYASGAAGAGVAYTLPNATTTVRGGVLQSAAQANSTATDVAGIVADFNAFLAKQRTAGQVAP